MFGCDGVEATFRSPAQCATRHLQFLDELGAILRVTQARPRAHTALPRLHTPAACPALSQRTTWPGCDPAGSSRTLLWGVRVSACFAKVLSCQRRGRAAQDGDVQLWGVHAGGLLDSLACADDKVTAAAALLPEPYVVLGCASGGLRVAALLDASGAPADAAREATSLSLQPYQRARPRTARFLSLSFLSLARCLELRFKPAGRRAARAHRLPRAARSGGGGAAGRGGARGGAGRAGRGRTAPPDRRPPGVARARVGPAVRPGPAR